MSIQTTNASKLYKTNTNPEYVALLKAQSGNYNPENFIPTTGSAIATSSAKSVAPSVNTNLSYNAVTPQSKAATATANAANKAAVIDGILSKQNANAPYSNAYYAKAVETAKEGPSIGDLIGNKLASANAGTKVNLNVDESGNNGVSGNGGLGGGYANVNYGGDYANQLSQMLLAYQNQQKEQLAAQQAAQAEQVRNAYLNNMNALDNAYNGQLGNLETIYNNTMEQMGNNYNYSADQIAQKADQALREAYINRMLSQKNLAQQLNANGLTGGAAESTIAGLLNNYGNSRNNIETARMNDLASLLNTYQNNVANAQESYSNAKSDAEKARMQYYMQLQNDLANGVLGTYDNMYGALASGSNTYANAMQNLASNMVNNAADLAATNYKNLINAAYKGSSSSSADSSAYQNAVNQMVAGGAGKDEVYNYLIQNDVPSSTILSIMRAAGLTS